VFFFIAVFAFPPTSYDPGTEAEVWPKFFQLPVLMLMLITLLNDGTLITIGYDYVIPSSRPEKWNLRVSYRISLRFWDLFAGCVHRPLCLQRLDFHALAGFDMVVGAFIWWLENLKRRGQERSTIKDFVFKSLAHGERVGSLEDWNLKTWRLKWGA
jgi:hypothetical protein